MEKNNFNIFKLAVFLVGIFSIFTIIDFSLNYLLLSFIPTPSPGQLMFSLLRVWPYIYMGIGFSVAIFFVVSLISLLVGSNNRHITVYIILLIIGSVFLAGCLVFYPFIDWVINFVGESSKELFFRVLYYVGSTLSFIILIVGWSGFKKGYINSGANEQVTGSITAIQVGNILAICTNLIFTVMWILIKRFPSFTNYLIFLIPLYILSYAYPSLLLTGYMVLSKGYTHMKPTELTPEPTLGFSPPPGKAPEPEYQHPKDHVCPNCGSKLALNTPYCPFCGSSTK